MCKRGPETKTTGKWSGMYCTACFDGIDPIKERNMQTTESEKLHHVQMGKIIRVRTADLLGSKYNPETRVKEDSKMRRLMKSLREHGQLIPAIITPSMKII